MGVCGATMTHNCPWLFWWSVQWRPQCRSQQTRPVLLLQYLREYLCTYAGFGRRLWRNLLMSRHPVMLSVGRKHLTVAKEDAECARAQVSAFFAVALGLLPVCGWKPFGMCKLTLLTVVVDVSLSLQDLEVTCSGASLRLKEPLMMMLLKVWDSLTGLKTDGCEKKRPSP